MELTDILIVLATLVSPFLAVAAQKALERWRSRHDQKIWIFKTLMATRATTLSPNHVQALNMIDLEFSGTSSAETRVRQLWREYLDQLGSLPENAAQSLVQAWNIKNIDCLVELLVGMGASLGYSFDRVYIKKSIYSPKGHATDEQEIRELRFRLLSVLKGEKALNIETKLVPQNDEAAQAGQRLVAGITAVAEGKAAIVVKSAEQA